MKICYYGRMKKFVFYYIILLPILFALFYWDVSPVAEIINSYQTKLALIFLDIGLEEGRLQGIDIMINPTYKIIVTKACNGMIPILVLFAAILAYPVSWVHKIKWIVIGYIVISTVNIVRLLMLAHFIKDQPDFPFYHDIVGNMLLMIVGLVLFYMFLVGSRRYLLIR